VGQDFPPGLYLFVLSCVLSENRFTLFRTHSSLYSLYSDKKQKNLALTNGARFSFWLLGKAS
jgi:hypothetical protein